jgi:hypothetical protein
MRCVVTLLPALLIGMLLGTAARADVAVGGMVSGVLSIADKQVPLPEGRWIVAGRATGVVTPDTGLGSYGAIWNVVLLRIAASTGEPDAMAEINVNAMAVDDGWGIAADCLRTDVALAVTQSRSGWDAVCYFVMNTTWHWDADLPDAWRQTRVMAAERGLRLPMGTVTAGFRVANRHDVIDVRFHFVAGPVRAQGAGARLAFDSDLADWSAMMIGCIEAGLKGRLDTTYRVPGPGANEALLERSSVAHVRQQRLEYLRSAGVLSPEQFGQQMALLRQAEAANGHDAVDPASEGFYRVLSFQGLSVTSDAIVTFLWTAQSVQAAAVTLLQATLRSGRSYVTAYFWDRYGGTPTRTDAARVVDFAYGGVDR